MAPTPQPTMTREQQQALAKARARARISTGAGLGPVNPMVVQGQAAQREYEAAGSPAIPKPQPVPAQAPRVDLRNVNRAPQTLGPGYAETPGSEIVGQDIQKGVRTIPQRLGNAAIGALESTINLPADLINSARQADAAFVPTALDAARNANRMPQMQARVGKQPTDPTRVPQLPTVQAPRIPIADDDQSVSGALLEGLVQYALVRKPLGMAAKGGGIASQLGKDIASTGIAFGGNSGRVSDIIDPAVIPAGPLRDYAIWLKTQPEDSPIMGRLKNMLEDATLSGPLLAPHAVVRGGQAIGNALKPSPVSPPASAVSPSPTAAAPAPAATVAPAATPSTPVTQPAVPQPPPRPAQAGTTSAGQQPAAGPAVAPTGAGSAQPVINATQVSPGVWQATPHQIKVARDTGKILTRIMRAGGVKDADVRGYLPGAVQRYKSLNDSRVPFAFFLEGDLPQHFPQGVAEDVVAKLQGWGRERNASTAPKDPSRSITQNTIKTLRGSQQEFLTKSAEANLFKGSLIGQEDQILKSLRETGKKGYEPVLAHARDAMEGRRVPTPEERAGFEDLRSVLARPVFRDRIPNDVRMTAEAEGLDLLELIERDPVTAAHWLQSNLNKLEDAAEINGRATPASLAYGKMRDDVLAPLKRAAPGYEGALNRYGHDWGAKNAVSFGRGAFTKARSAYDTGQMVRAFKRLGRRQQTVAWKSIRDEFLNEFRGTAEDAAAKLTRMQQEGALDLLEQLGARGKKFADDIRKIAQQENPSIRAIDQGSGSPTHSNQKGAKDARENVQSPINKAIGALTDKASWPMTIAGDVLIASQTGVPLPLLTASKALDKFGNPSRAVLGRATEGLYALPKPQANALALPAPPKPRGTRRIGKPKEPRGPQDLGSLLKQLDEAETNARTRGGPEGKRLLDEIAAERKRLAEAQAANALAPPPSPPVKAGFGGSKPLDMSEAGRGRSLLQELARPNEPQRIADLLAGSPVSVTREEAKEMLDLIRMHLRPKDPYDYGRGFGFTLDELKADPSIAEEFLDFDPQKLAQFQAVLGTIGRPSQSGSSKLLAGMGASPEAVGAGVGGAAGYALAPDQNGDGVVDAQERRLGAVGGMFSGLALTGAGRAGVRRFSQKGEWGDLGPPLTGEELDAALKKNKGKGPPEQQTFGGVKAKTADLKLQRIAQDMEKAGASRDQIWKETGWFKGNDGKWRFEIDDRDAGLKGPRKKLFAGSLKGVMTDADAGGAYPNVAKTLTVVDPHPYGMRPNASMTPADGKVPARLTIEVPHNTDMKGRAAFGKPYDQEGLGREMLLHERQHVIQDAEDFARGGSPRDAAAEYYDREATPIKARMAELEAEAFGQNGPATNSAEFKRLRSEFYRLKDDLDKLDNLNELDIYNRLAGEVEARNVQERRDFTPEQRRSRPPWTTQDTSDENQIISYRSGQANSIFGGGRKPPTEPPAAAPGGPRLVSSKAGTEAAPLHYLDAGEQASRMRAMGASDAAIAKRLGLDQSMDGPLTQAEISAEVNEAIKAWQKSESKPTQQGFGGSPPKPPGNALRGPKKKVAEKLSPAAEVATQEVKRIRRLLGTAQRRWVMRDDRELRVKPLEEELVKAEANLAQVLRHDAKLKALEARGRAFIESPNVLPPLAGAVVGAGTLGLGIVGYNALMPKREGPPPMSPKDPKFYWNSVSKRKDAVTQVQAALNEWGEWPSDVEFTGTPGNTTKAALETWRYNMRQLQLDKKVLGREFDVDAPISRDEMGMLLAGPGGYREGKAWKTKHGDAVQVPTP